MVSTARVHEPPLKAEHDFDLISPYKRGAGGSNPPAPTSQVVFRAVTKLGRCAINVPLAVRLSEVIGGPGTLDHAADGVRDEAAGLGSGVLVHHRGAHAVVAHAVHQVPQARPASSRERIAGMRRS